MVLSLAISIFVFGFALIKSADSIIIAVRRLSSGKKSSMFALSAIILAIGTSLPEIFIGITSSLEGDPGISLGNVTGSNIANIALIAALAALVVGKVNIKGKFARKDFVIALSAGVIPALLMADGLLSRFDGIILIILYITYIAGFFRIRFLEIAKIQMDERFFYKFIREFNHKAFRKKQEIARLILGFAVMIFSANALVKSSVSLAEILGISEFVIGLLVIAIGTSLPEFAFSIKSLENKQPSMFLGNLLGSTIANSTLVVGLTAMIMPIKTVAVSKFFISTGVFVLVFVSFWYMIRSKQRFDRWEATLLLLVYLVFVVLILAPSV